MIRRSVWLSAILSLLFCAWPAAAHHSFAAEYDSTKTIQVKGTVAKVAWKVCHLGFRNPEPERSRHPRLVADVIDHRRGSYR